MIDFYQTPHDDYEVLNRCSRSFALAAKVLPISVRGDVARLYAWCRWCDDAVDQATNVEEARGRLAELRADVVNAYRGEPLTHPASDWLRSVAIKYEIPMPLPLDLLAGMEMDLEHQPSASVEDLLRYAYHAAGAVGLMMSHIFRATAPDTLVHAKAMGMAMQLTNIARDIKEDWLMGRKYVPQSWLSDRPGVAAESPGNEAVRSATQKLLQLADEFYEIGFAGLQDLPNGPRLGVRLAGSIYREIGREIERHDYAVMDRRMVVPFWRKCLLGCLCLSSEANFRARRFLQGWVAHSARHVTLFRSVLFTTTAGGDAMKTDTWYMLFLGFSLTFIMSAALFVLVGINPKEAAYGTLPWYYAGGSIVLATLTGFAARWIDRSERESAMTRHGESA
jgi:15-cis-phytoene synthase